MSELFIQTHLLCLCSRHVYSYLLQGVLHWHPLSLMDQYSSSLGTVVCFVRSMNTQCKSCCPLYLSCSCLSAKIAWVVDFLSLTNVRSIGQPSSVTNTFQSEYYRDLSHFGLSTDARLLQEERRSGEARREHQFSGRRDGSESVRALEMRK